MAHNLVALPNAWAVDQAIVTEEDRVVIIRWGQEATPECMLMDKTLAGVVVKLQNMAVIYTVDIEDIPDFNKMYELYDPVCIMFFFKNRHIRVDVGTGNNNKSTFGTISLQAFFVTSFSGFTDNSRLLLLSEIGFSQLATYEQAGCNRYDRGGVARR